MCRLRREWEEEGKEQAGAGDERPFSGVVAPLAQEQRRQPEGKLDGALWWLGQ